MTTLSSLIATYGYIIVAICIMLESAGLPFPGETALLLAAAAAGTGQLSLPIVIAVAACCSDCGRCGRLLAGAARRTTTLGAIRTYPADGCSEACTYRSLF